MRQERKNGSALLSEQAYAAGAGPEMPYSAERAPDWIFSQEKSTLSELSRVYLFWFCSQNRELANRFQQNQEFSPDHIPQAIENRELRGKS